MIRDIKINYGELKRLLYQLNRYRKALVQMGESVVKIQNTLKKNKGFAITALVEQSSEIEKEIKSIKGEVDSIYNIINQYVIDMTRIITPVRESQMMQVDRNDIYWNKESINGLCDSVSSIPRRISTYGDCDFWPFDEDEEERERRHRNDEKLSQIQSLLSNTSKLFGVYKEQMNELYKVVQKYENMDDSYSKQAKALKQDNTSFAEGLDDIGKGAKKIATDVAQGVVEGSADLVKGLVDTVGGVLKYDGAFLTTAYGEVTGTDIPDSLEKYYEEKSEMANAVIKDPSLIGEGIAQQVSDGAEEKGVAYSVGYAAPIVASFVVGDKGASKAGSVGKVSKVTSKLDDVANAVNKTSKVDDVVNSVNKVSIADDVANGVNKASKVDDILNEGSKVADDVAKVPKSEIVMNTSKTSYAQSSGKSATIKNIQSKSPQQLITDGWEDVTNPRMKANTNSREFYDPKSGLKIRFDKGIDGVNGFEAVDHYHVMNPNYTNKKVDYYLDINGNPVGKGSKASHIAIKGEE